MDYFFPGLLSKDVLLKVEDKEKVFPFEHHLNSGENALRLVLKSFDLPVSAKIAIPAFVCSSVRNAVIKEGLEPIVFDLKNDNSFWTDYSRLDQKEIKVVLLVHLYGFIHPDTSSILEYCKNNNIHIIHDAAQSFGIDKKNIPGVAVYSFGPGKSTTAGGGAVIDQLKNKNVYQNTLQKYSPFERFMVSSKSRLFLKSRIFNYSFGMWERFFKRLIDNAFSAFINSDCFYGMTLFQQNIAMESIVLIEIKQKERFSRYQILKESIANNVYISIAYNNDKGLFFKCVLFVKENTDIFKEYLENNSIPFYRLSDDLGDFMEEQVNFNSNANHFFEISSEASIPMEEIYRVASVLKSYK